MRTYTIHKGGSAVEYRGLRIAKDILFRIFIIGYLFLIVAWLLWVGAKEQWMSLFTTTWHFSNPAFIDMVTMGFFALAKFVLLFYALIPALAICWTLRKLDKKGR